MQKTTICNYSLVSLRSKKTKETKKTKKTKKTMIPTWAQTQYAKADSRAEYVKGFGHQKP
jgi:hypothetical protein